jgi:cyclopropane-fatty-acyl-phospholipid synthase
MNTQSPKRGRQFAAPRPGYWARFIAERFHRALDRIDTGLESGAIEAMLPDGSFRVLGGRNPGPVAQVDLNKWAALVRLARSGSAGWYRAWENGEWASPDPVPLFDLFMRNRVSLGETGRPSGVSRLARRIAHKFNRNSRGGARKNIMAHYDLGNDFYRAWLDRTMSYSSAIFAEPINGEEGLETAQERKVCALGNRLKLKPGSTILEIGCGWGFFSRLFAAKGYRVTAITISPSQKLWAEQAMEGANGDVDYRLLDYRDVEGQFDAIASIEMVEAVGQRYWPDYLDAIDRCLRPGGRAAIQYIAIADDIFEGYAASVDFIQAYIFPGGMLLSESRFRALAEARGLKWEDAHHFPLHYAETLRRWRMQFDDAVETGSLPSGFDQRFVSLWRYYLMYCEGGFRGGGITVAQVTLVKEGKCLEEVDSGRSLAAYGD